MSTTFIENVTTTLEINLGRISASMKVTDPSKDPKVLKRLSEYVSYWMTQNGWRTALQVEQRAKKLGVWDGVSDATVGNILNQQPFKIKVQSLRNLAITLGRPPEEIFMIAIGKDPKKLPDEPDEIVSLKQIYSVLPESELAYYRRQIADLIRNMQATD